MKRVLPALMLAAVALCGPLSGAAAQEVQRGALPQGGAYAIASDPASPTAAIDVWFRAPDDGYGKPVPGLARVAATAAAAAKLESGRSLAEVVAQLGGRLNIEVFPDIVGISVVIPASDARVVLASLTAAYFTPQIDDSALHSAQSDAAVLAVQQQYETEALAHAALFAQIFASGPAHEPPIPLAADDISHVTLDQATAFAGRAFRASNAFVTLAGDVTPEILSVATPGAASGTPDPPLDSATASSSSQPTTQSGAVPGIGIAWIGPPISDERAATAMDFISDYLFYGGSGTVVRALRQKDGSLDLDGQFITLHDPGVMIVTVAGSDDGKVQGQILDAVSAMQQPLPPAAFDAAREAFLYHLSATTQTAEEEAANLGWYAAEGASGYAPGGAQYESVARSLTPDYVASVVRRYLTQPAIVRITQASATGGSS